MATTDLALLCTAVTLASLLILGTAWRLFAKLHQQLSESSSGAGLSRRRSRIAAVASSLAASSAGGGSLGFLLLAFIACLFYLVKVSVALLYALVLWLDPRPRYFAVYFMFNLSTLLLYFLYERRLALLFGHDRRTAATVYSWILRVLMFGYLGVTLVMSYFFVAYAGNTATGGYSSNPPFGYRLRMANYAIDMAIGATILAGTAHALVGIVAQQRHLAGATSSTAASLFKIILGSDCLKFSLIAAIEAYKLANSSDPTSKLGALPGGNTGFQHLIDTVRIVLLVVNLFAPVAIARTVAAAVKTQNSTAGLSSGPGIGSVNGSVAPRSQENLLAPTKPYSAV
ncbi:hypothetical protein HK405_000265 [Cladochytrium tenue]|nr:hypothetical protein HK405_000265 [Cladochytrium tenue]